MSAKITLTGYPAGPIELFSDYFRFDMEEGGSGAPPEGLPAASSLTFTVFVSKKAGNKLGFPETPTEPLLIQGDLTAELTMDQCPGELGVISFRVEKILPKDTQKKAQENPDTQADSQNSAQWEEETWPNLSEYPNLPLSEVIIPEKFQPPNAKKTAELQNRILHHGQLDEPITVQLTDDSQYLLIDGYKRYLVAQNLGWVSVPARIKENVANSTELEPRDS